MAKIHGNIILEILGRPQEHVKNALNELVNKLGSEKGISIFEKTIHEPIIVKDSNDLFTSFAELTIEFDSLDDYFGILFAYMPSHTECIYPEKMNLLNTDMNNLLNRILLRLHEYDAIAKNIIIERDILAKKLHEVAPEMFKKPDEQPINQQSSNKNKKPKLNNPKKRK